MTADHRAGRRAPRRATTRCCATYGASFTMAAPPMRGAGDAFARFRADGGTVLLLSNAPMPSTWVARVLDEKGVRRDSWDAIVSSGDIALAHSPSAAIAACCTSARRATCRCSRRMPASALRFDEAEAIVCTGLVDDRNETAETYRPLLERALARSMPLVCANPDLIVDVGGELLPCAGVIAELYEDMGGEVYWAGKPYPPAYRSCASRRSPGCAARPLPTRPHPGHRRRGAHRHRGRGAAGIDSLFIAPGHPSRRGDAQRSGRCRRAGAAACGKCRDPCRGDGRRRLVVLIAWASCQLPAAPGIRTSAASARRYRRSC